MKPNLPPFSELKHVHIVGVCGTLMGSFAAFLKRKGLLVTGSDANIYPPMSDVLQSAGVVLCEGYQAENLKKHGKPDLVVIGNVIRSDNPEARATIEGGYAYGSLPEVMESLWLEKTRNLVVAGTHGKTTTSTLLSHVLKSLRQGPSYFIGGVSQDLPESFHVDSGKYFVLEGDEYDTAFWDKVPKFNHYLPNDVILTSVEFDHADIYKDLGSVMDAFSGLLDRMRKGKEGKFGNLVVCTDYENVKKIVSQKKGLSPVTYSSSDKNADYWVGEPKQEGDYSVFSLRTKKDESFTVKIRLSGKHNALNASAVFILARQLGFNEKEILDAIATFRGVKRRLEVRGEVKGVVVIDDFAHHPTAVKGTIVALRQRYPNSRLHVVFEPRSATSRRNVFQKEYAQAFSGADFVYIAQPYDQTRIPENERFSSDLLVKDLATGGVQGKVFREVPEAVTLLVGASSPGDVIAVLSNGGFGGLIPKLLDSLKSK